MPDLPDALDLIEMIGSRLEAAQVRDADGVAALVSDVVSPVLERLRAELADACALVAAMHAAAVGEVRGPARGVVEDVEDVRQRAEQAEAELATERASGVEYQRQIGYLADDVKQAEATIARIRTAVINTYGEDYNGEDVAAVVERLLRHLSEYETDARRILAAKNDALEQAEAERDALKAARCPSCDHFAYHHDEGCWYAVASGTEGRDLVCPCVVSRAALDASSAPESPRRAALRDLTQEAIEAGSYGEPAPPMRPVSIASPGNDGFRYEPEPDVIEMTPTEWNTALANTLADLGLTWEQLAEQAAAHDFSSLRARKLWLTAGPQGFLSAPESPTDAPTAPTRPDDTHQPHNDPETTP